MPVLIERKIRVDGGFAFDLALPLDQTTNPPTLRFAECHFKPIDPSNPESPHVADVPSERIAAMLLAAAPETYAAYEGLPQ